MYDFSFYQACMGQTQLVYKVGWKYSGIYGLKFSENKGVKVFLFFFSLFSHFFFIGGFNWFKEWIIQLD